MSRITPGSTHHLQLIHYQSLTLSGDDKNVPATPSFCFQHYRDAKQVMAWEKKFK